MNYQKEERDLLYAEIKRLKKENKILRTELETYKECEEAFNKTKQEYENLIVELKNIRDMYQNENKLFGELKKGYQNHLERLKEER